jgi:hypothetical protein
MADGLVMDWHDDGGVALRLAAVTASLAGVNHVTIANADGVCLASAPAGDARDAAALTMFLLGQAGALTEEDGDLRGMGRQLTGSRLQEVLLTGPAGDTAAYPWGTGGLLVEFRAGVLSAVTRPSIHAALRRYNR